MANSGAKFVSVNLNKSYGQQHQPSHHTHHSAFSGSGTTGSYGHSGAGVRGRSGSGGAGMVVLSRNRGAQKAGPKLSVPPPLNLPSLRKEHERFDPSGQGGGAGGGVGPGSGPRPTSSGLGWSKPVAATTLTEKNETGVGVNMADRADATLGHGSSSNLPFSGQPDEVGVARSGYPARTFLPSTEKATVLRGEDFPTLQAARPVSSGTSQKQKDALNLKQKQVVSEETSAEKKDIYNSSLLVDMRQRGQSSRSTVGNGFLENGGESHVMGSSRTVNQAGKQEDYFPGPLPLVHFNPRSDWADDERDTGPEFVERGREVGVTKTENYWDRDFDLPRPSALPHKLVHHQNQWSQRDNETGKVYSGEVLKSDPYSRDLRTTSREGKELNKWRTSPLPKDGISSQDTGIDRNDIVARTYGPNNAVKENKYIPPHFGDTARDNVIVNRDSSFGRKDVVHVPEVRQRWNNPMELHNSRGSERNIRDRYGAEQTNRYRSDNFQNNALAKSSFSLTGKVPPMTDTKLTLGREKQAFSKGDRLFSEDPFSKDFGSAGFDERELFSGGLGIIKRKKDVAWPTDFHDPVRESFEAELERVQKMQELERQRIIEEQERALEQARREEEERLRRIREEEERQRRLEEEARESAWRAEQERLEAIRIAEEQRIAREEEKKRALMEEERRKQAAKQKLLELEARMAKRQAEAVVVENKLDAVVKEKDSLRTGELDNWEESERMVDKMVTSTPFDSSAYDRPFDISSRPYPPKEGSSSFFDRGKSVNSWKRDTFENVSTLPLPAQDQEIGHNSPRRDTFGGGRTAPRKEFYGGSGYMTSRAYSKVGTQEPFLDQKDHRWNLPGDVDLYSKTREINSDFHDNLADRYGEMGFEHGHARNTRSPYPERLYLNPEADELYPYGRSRYSMKQPRVLPPPLASSQRTSFRGVDENPSRSAVLDNHIHYTYRSSDSTRQADYFGGNQEALEPSEAVELHQEKAASEDQKLKDISSRCDSQSSLSVSSPPTSPPHLSNDELDESGDSPVISIVAEGKKHQLAGNDSSGNNTIMVPQGLTSVVEDEEWTPENDDELQQQEEYDEDEDGYQEEDEVREVDDGNLELDAKFEDLHLVDRDSSHILENVVLGFDDGVEVVIPSDDFGRNSGTEECTFGISGNRISIVEEQEAIDRVPDDEQSFLPADSSFGTGKDSSGKILESKMALSGDTVQSISAPFAAAETDLLYSDASGNPGLPAQQTISASGDVTSAAGQTSMSSVVSGGTQADVPVKLQFGLFSGPSLIPSPVPAIQIGSIQMPLHIHPPVGPSLTQVHSSQPPIFQFGQLRYTSSVSQGILPMPPQSMSFVQPNMQVHYNLSQNAGGSVRNKSAPDALQHAEKVEVTSLSANEETSSPSLPPEESHEKHLRELGSVLPEDSSEGKFPGLIRSVVSDAGDNKVNLESGFQAEERRQRDSDPNNHLSSSKENGSASHLQHVQPSSKYMYGDKNFSRSRPQGPLGGSKGRRYAYAVKNTNTRSSILAPDTSTRSNGFQRKPKRTVQQSEFQVRENEKKQVKLESGATINNGGSVDKSNYKRRAVGLIASGGSKRGAISNRPLKQRVESESSVSGNTSSQELNSSDRLGKESLKDLSVKKQNISPSREANFKRNVSEEDVDAPLQSGVVRVYKQPGIEAPSDEDDFIEVRSKRQMLNDRREQREKEIKAKSRIAKLLPKSRAHRQSAVVSTSPNKLSASLGRQSSTSPHMDPVASEGKPFGNKEVSTGVTEVPQPLAPIGTPAVNTESPPDISSHAITSLQTETDPVFSNKEKDHETDKIFENNKVSDNYQSSASTWGTAAINQQVMTLTQTQLEEAMKPARYDSHISIEGHSSTVNDPVLPSSSMLTKDKSFSSGASPINSLLAGEKIQFGAVTSPTVLPPTNRVVSHRIGAPGSKRPDVQKSRNLSATENDCSLFFDEEKHSGDSCAALQESEAEAEAAASAIAVAAISTDDIVTHSLGSVGFSDSKNFRGADIDGIILAVSGDQQLANQSRGEESLSVSLPADLSVETTPISLWPTMPSPQSSTPQMLSQFPAGPPSHFPFYEMNPILGGPIFAFSPREDSSCTQSQPQNGTATSSRPPGTWQQCHSSLDSIYGPPAGYTGPFISPPGGIPGVQGPPHMVVYNHFAPVGQYGQVGLSFMGTTYIPSGKQSDWKHNTTSSAMHVGEGEMSSMNTTTAQRNVSNMAAPVQHLAPGSPLLPIASPLPMFDVSPFQSAPDMSVQVQWPHLPASPLHSLPPSRPSQQQADAVLPSQVSRGHSIDQPLNANRFSDFRVSTPSKNDATFSVAPDTNVTQLAAELGLADSLRCISSGTSAQIGIDQNSTGNANDESGETEVHKNGIDKNGEHQSTNSLNTQPFAQKNASVRQGNSSSYSYQGGGGMSQRNNTGNEWSYRRMGYQGRNQSASAEKGGVGSKMKQIYVAKQIPSGSSRAV